MSELSEGHIVRGYDVDLAALRMKLLEMGGLVLDQVKCAVRALTHADADLARRVIAREQEVNEYDLHIEEDSIALIARRQPMGSDLRIVISIARAVADLERIGDEAKKIARYAAGESVEHPSPPSGKLARDARNMSRLALAMLRDALDSFDRMDPRVAAEISRRDVELNAEFQAALRHQVTLVMEDPRSLQATLAAVFVLKALERVGDHAKSIARHVVYLVQGRDVRHEDTAVLAALNDPPRDASSA
ncbi:MAG TPA: phosphate signaling complex protein PhoU [Steroidobacteraceae bacterium]|nr:phosphate signaling complex protein PhoU [Steroidobacteraceae bacterium]